MGYAKNSKAYRILDLESNVIMESRDVEFIENKFINNFIRTESENDPVNEGQGDSSTINHKKIVDTPSEPRRSQRAKKEKSLGSDFVSSKALVFLVEGSRNFILRQIPIVLNIEEGDPKTYSEAMASRDVAFWREAINDEMDSILSNNIWMLVDLPLDSKSIGCKWIFRKKYNSNDNL